MVTSNNNSKLFPGPNEEADRRESAKITKQLQSKFKDIFPRIDCFGGAFSLQVKVDSTQYQAPLWWMWYALQKIIKRRIRAFVATKHYFTTRHR